MEKLRILKVRTCYDNYGDFICDGLNYLSNELRVLDWRNCPLLSLPSNFHGEKLIHLYMGGSNIRDLGTRLQSKNLTKINLNGCRYLTNICDLSSCSNLEKLCFCECKSLVEVHDSVGFLDKLVKLNFAYCSNLKKLPRSFKLRCLEFLVLDGCTSLEYFPEIECEMEHLEWVKLESCVIQELPSSITYLTRLNSLYLERCESLVRLPIKIFQLERLVDVTIICCPNFVNFVEEVGHNRQSTPYTHENLISSSMELLPLQPPESNNLSRTYNFSSSLRTLNLSRSGIVSLPPCIEGFVGLLELDLRDCKQLEEILRLPPNIKEVDVRGCSSLKNFLPESNNLSWTYHFSSNLKTLNLSSSGIVSLPPCIEGFVGLLELDLRDCKQLEEILRLPPNIKSIVSLPPCIEGFVGLLELDLRDCKNLEEILCLPPNIKEVDARRCSSLKNFLPESNNLSRTYNFSSSLKTLNLSGSGIISLPPCIEGFVGLSELDLRDCKQLEEILRLPPNIKENLSRTYNFSSSLKTLNLSGSGIVSLPPCIEGFVRLSELDLRDCKQLEEILCLPPNIEEVYVSGCWSLKSFLPESNNLSRTYNFSSSLRTLNLSGSGIISLPPCIEGFVRLSELDLRDCKQLEEILRLPPNIEEVYVSGCWSLKSFLPESNNLSRTYNFSSSLRTLNLSGSGIISLPPCIEGFVRLSELDLRDCKQLEEILRLPPNIEEVYVSGCWSLKSFLPESNNLSRTYNFSSSLRTLNLSGSGIVSLPPCIEGFVGLLELDLRDCKQIEEILRLPPNIKEVDVRGCSSLKNFLPESNNLSRTYNFSSSLKTLNLSGSGIVSLPPCIEGFVGLLELDLRDCKQLEEILRLPPNIKEVNARRCSSLKNFLPESNNLSRTYNFSSNLRTLNLSGSGIVSLPPCIERFVGLSELNLRFCKQLKEILHLPPNIEEVDAIGCVLLEHFPQVSTEFSFGTPDLKWLRRINLSECNKVEVDVGNHAPDPLWVQECFREKDSSRIIYPGSRIPEWFKYYKETTSFGNYFEIEIDHNASMCFGHQIVALVLCFVVGPLPAWPLYGFTISINGQWIENDDTRLWDSVDPHDHVCLKYIAGNSINEILSRSYREGNNNMRFTFESDSEKAILKSVGVHLIYGNDNFINPIQLSKRY
ncbi:putative disease resistance protein At4g19050 [Carya illinoinensis]|uniref:putative disease resistance protein At4g19050 n=1 Tax=Carya illinoinensis TaxID=32201 RepID=UPI001C71B1B0|nr:putative disease resistance protein At4g19050 [Carya illinoinensis]